MQGADTQRNAQRLGCVCQKPGDPEQEGRWDPPGVCWAQNWEPRPPELPTTAPSQLGVRAGLPGSA